jgi:hypothetical protein
MSPSYGTPAAGTATSTITSQPERSVVRTCAFAIT